MERELCYTGSWQVRGGKGRGLLQGGRGGELLKYLWKRREDDGGGVQKKVQSRLQVHWVHVLGGGVEVLASSYVRYSEISV